MCPLYVVGRTSLKSACTMIFFKGTYYRLPSRGGSRRVVLPLAAFPWAGRRSRPPSMVAAPAHKDEKSLLSVNQGSTRGQPESRCVLSTAPVPSVHECGPPCLQLLSPCPYLPVQNPVSLFMPPCPQLHGCPVRCLSYVRDLTDLRSRSRAPVYALMWTVARCVGNAVNSHSMRLNKKCDCIRRCKKSNVLGIWSDVIQPPLKQMSKHNIFPTLGC